MKNEERGAREEVDLFLEGVELDVELNAPEGVLRRLAARLASEELVAQILVVVRRRLLLSLTEELRHALRQRFALHTDVHVHVHVHKCTLCGYNYL